MKEENFISAVINLLGTREEISSFLLEADKFFSANFNHFEIILINNGLQEAKPVFLEEIKERLSGNIIILSMAWKHNKEQAMLAGTELAIGDYIFEMDNCTHSFDPRLAEQIYSKALEGFDIVSAVPVNRQQASSRLFYRLLNKFSYLNLSLKTETIRIISRRALNRTLELKEKIRYRKALYRISGFPYAEIEYHSKKRIESDLTFRERLKLSVDILFSYSNIGLQISFILSVIFLVISLLLGLYALYIYFILKIAIKGWTTTMLFLSFGFSGMFFVLSLLSKYMTIIMFQVYNRPTYTVYKLERLEKNIETRIVNE